MPQTDRDELLGRLLGVPLDRFVEQRNRLARELRSQGDRETATWLAGLRRPSPAVWALDQVARGDASRLRSLLEAGEELRDVQARAMRGDREAAARMREAGAQMQRTLDDVVRRAAALLRDAGHGVTTDTTLRMAALLRTALAADDEVRRQLAAGVLLGPVEEREGGVFGFDAGPPQLRVIEGGGGGAAAEPRARRGGGGEARPAEEPPDEVPDEAERLAELRRRAAEAAHAAEAAEREEQERREDSERLRLRVAELRRQVAALQEELGELETQAHDAEVAAREAQARARAARRDADAAEAALPRG